ncbi:MAG: amidohydrolase family protein [Alphaproteobacteria bacterium]|nr:amidohydrolase family protein [Alphaproteobacteria bacterium]
MATTDDWLVQVREDALEPDLPILDPHHHLWEFRTERVEPRYLLDEILRDINESGHNILATVFIECGAMYKADGPEAMKPIGETEFVNGIAAMSASGLYGPTRVAAGIISTADLQLGAAVGDVLDAHIAAGGGRFRGIRRSATWDASDAIPNARIEPGPHLFMDPKYREGFAQLAPRNMTFEGWCYHPHITELTDLARAFPDTTIILNHFGAPLGVGPYAGKREEIFEQWQKDIAELATCPNVNAKLGGLNMAFNGFHWEDRPKPPTSQELLDATRPYFEHTLQHFGVERCLFESNFPVDKLSCSYGVLWNSFKRLTKDYSAAEKAALYHDNAARVYSIETSASKK